MNGRIETKYVALVLLFIFCQVIGTMCALPDLSVAEEIATLVEEGMVCPMDGTIMCPPSITSSPERQIMHVLVADFDHATILLGSAAGLPVRSAPSLWSWSSSSSIVPISISSPSVLRI
ncbi:MAG TPA: hypothetical protein VLD60_11480 [Nitrospira sp.]|nr:hypothetical protein [Nitrospira sp.]